MFSKIKPMHVEIPRVEEFDRSQAELHAKPPCHPQPRVRTIDLSERTTDPITRASGRVQGLSRAGKIDRLRPARGSPNVLCTDGARSMDCRGAALRHCITAKRSTPIVWGLTTAHRSIAASQL